MYFRNFVCLRLIFFLEFWFWIPRLKKNVFFCSNFLGSHNLGFNFWLKISTYSNTNIFVWYIQVFSSFSSFTGHPGGWLLTKFYIKMSLYIWPIFGTKLLKISLDISYICKLWSKNGHEFSRINYLLLRSKLKVKL